MARTRHPSSDNKFYYKFSEKITIDAKCKCKVEMLTISPVPIQINKVKGYANADIDEPGYELFDLDIMSSSHPGDCSVHYSLLDALE